MPVCLSSCVAFVYVCAEMWISVMCYGCKVRFLGFAFIVLCVESACLCGYSWLKFSLQLQWSDVKKKIKTTYQLDHPLYFISKVFVFILFSIFFYFFLFFHVTYSFSLFSLRRKKFVSLFPNNLFLFVSFTNHFGT